MFDKTNITAIDVDPSSETVTLTMSSGATVTMTTALATFWGTELIKWASVCDDRANGK